MKSVMTNVGEIEDDGWVTVWPETPCTLDLPSRLGLECALMSTPLSARFYEWLHQVLPDNPDFLK